MGAQYFKAITVKWLPSTAARPARLKATCAAGSLTRAYEYDDVDTEKDHLAQALADKFGWRGTWHKGELPDGTVCYVCDGFAFTTEGGRANA